jgi:RHS repeat-associated protein
MQGDFNYDCTPQQVHLCCLNAFRCTGKERDAESGLDYFGARYLSSNMGRFMSPDWSAKEEPVPYSKLDDPQSLNLYSYVLNNPLSKSDPDGHEDCCDFAKGVLQGVVSSLTGGAMGSAPSSSDSDSSLHGQMLGSAMVTAAGIMGDADAATKIGGGMMLAPETGGVSLTVSAVGVGEAAISTAAIQAGSNNAAAVGTAMERRAGDFSKSTREGAIKDNADKNGGTNKCEKCGGDVQRVGNQKGQSPPGDQLQVHHDPAIKDGGGKDSKPVVVCRDCHVDIHNP